MAICCCKRIFKGHALWTVYIWEHLLGACTAEYVSIVSLSMPLPFTDTQSDAVNSLQVMTKKVLIERNQLSTAMFALQIVHSLSSCILSNAFHVLQAAG